MGCCTMVLGFCGFSEEFNKERETGSTATRAAQATMPITKYEQSSLHQADTSIQSRCNCEKQKSRS